MRIWFLLLLVLVPIVSSADIVSCELDRGYKIAIYFDPKEQKLLTLHDYETKQFSEFVSIEPMANGELKILAPYEKTIPAVITRVGDKKSSTTYGVAIESNGYPIIFSIERWSEGSPIRYFDPYLGSMSVLEGTCSG